MIGFVVTPKRAEVILAAISRAQTDKGRAVPYWTTGAFPIYRGEHAGMVFIPADDKLLSSKLRNGLTVRDFPEFPQLLALLGGLDARIDLDPAAILDPPADATR
jgi:hypothetical protein